MRKYLLLLLAAGLSFAAIGQLNVQYSFTKPLLEQGENIGGIHSFVLGADFKLKKAPITIGPDFAFGLYGLKTEELPLAFTNGYITETNVNYTTSMNTYAVKVQYFPIKNQPVRPYIAARGGVLHYKSKMVIEDPEDPTGCKALEQDILLSDATWMASGGAGVKIRLKKEVKGFDLDIGVHYTAAGEAEYLKISTDHVNDPKARPYYVKFEHLPTGEIHEHPIGKVYSTKANMIEVRVGLSFGGMGKCCKSHIKKEPINSY